MDNPYRNPLIAAGLTGLAVVLLTKGANLLGGAALLGNGTPDIWGHAWGYGWAAEQVTQFHLPWGHAPVRAPQGCCFRCLPSGLLTPLKRAHADTAWPLLFWPPGSY